MKVSIIIVNYHTSSLIIDCLKSVIKQTLSIDYEVIVVDNNSEPELSIVLKNTFPESSNIHILQLSENIGFGRANNEGAKMAEGEFLFFLNPDTLLLNNAIKILADFLDSNQSAGICGANLFNVECQPTFSHFMYLPGIKWELNNTLHNLIANFTYRGNFMHNHTNNPLEVGFISGADLMIRKWLFDKIKGFDPHFFMYFEETDLCLHVWKAGFKIFNVPTAKIVHLEGGSVNTVKVASSFKIEQLERSRSIYFHKNLTPISRFTSYLLYEIYLRSRVLLIRNPQKKEQIRHFLSFMKKYRHNS